MHQRSREPAWGAVQLIGHEQRGYAWTRALLGLQADEIHVCGDPSALGLLRSMTGVMREPMVVHHYERLRPLVVSLLMLACGLLCMPGLWSAPPLPLRRAAGHGPKGSAGLIWVAVQGMGGCLRAHCQQPLWSPWW